MLGSGRGTWNSTTFGSNSLGAYSTARWVWSRGKDGDYIKVLPIAIKVKGALVEEALSDFRIKAIY